MIKLSDYVIKFILELGVKHVFVFAGGGAMHLNDSLGRCKEMGYVCTLHEQAAAIAMEGYSQYTGNLGVAMVTTGPGGTNAVTGVAAAWIDSIPCVVISGQVKRADLMGNSGVRQMGTQEVNIVKIVDSITKYAVTILDPNTIRYHLEKAVYFAKTGRPGPVWLDIPLDVQATMIDEHSLAGFIEPESTVDNSALKANVDKMIELLTVAERPVILAGNGIRLGHAEKEFRDLIEQLNIPVLTTWKAADLLEETNELFMGRPGVIGQRGANFVQQNADLLITMGARLDLVQTGYNHTNFAPVAKKVFIDIDPNELAKMQTNIDLSICCDVKNVILELLKRNIKMQNIDVINSWKSQCARWKERYPVVINEYWDNKDGVNTYILVEVLAELMQETDILVPGSSGACAEITLQSYKAKKGQRIINSPGLGAMGFGIPASIGVCLASGCKRTVAIDGDGGIQLNIQELETLARLQLPVKIFVLNNQGYGSIRNTQTNYFGGHYVACGASSGLTLPDILKVAQAYGIKTSRITSQENIREDVLAVLNTEGPLVCEVMTPVDLLTAPKMSSKQNPDGSMVSKPLEDLWPFLDEEEVAENTIYINQGAKK
ncbi:MAG: thiamine pyrophosphate-binding protein [Firmicutes bacterium]|nr:thiamine pyrophosphate-binding protein [Bacillota bacterium]